MFRYTNIALDVFSACVFLIVLASTALDEKEKSKSNTYFRRIIFDCICLIIGDCSDWIFGGHSGIANYYIMWFGIELFYVASSLLLNNLLLYVKSILEKNGPVSKNYVLIGRCIVLYTVIYCFITIFTRHVYYIDSDNVYRRGSLYFATQIPIVLYVLIVIMVATYKNQTTKKQKVFLLLFTITPATGEVIQLIVPGLATLIPSLSIGLLFLMIFIQTESKITDTNQEKEILGIKNHELSERLDRKEKMITQIMKVLTNSAELEMSFVRGSGVRVGNYTREIAYRMGLSEEFQVEAYYAGMLRDIGMIKVDKGILMQPGKLSDEQYGAVKLHSIYGFHFVKQMTEYQLIRDAVRWHHERYDGKGYPNGIAGEEIPLIARIVCVADAYDAMTSNRPYRDKLSRQEVKEEFEKNSGTQFDPKIVEVILEMISEDLEYDLRAKNINEEKSILLVDDDPVVHEVLETAMENNEYSIICVSSGREAIQLLKHEDFSLCILDVEMPEMNGFEVLEWINEHKLRMKIMFMTQTRDINIIRKLEDLDIWDYITKPISIPVLQESVKNILDTMGE